MKSFRSISLFTLHFLLYAICSAQNEQLPFNLVPPPGGLHPGSKVGIQDSEGYMWIGAYHVPLHRYDGYHYTFYSNDPLDSNSLAQNWVEALSEGHDGMIWVGTTDRIAILQQTSGQKSAVTINDLINADGTAAGTEVAIKIPMKCNNKV